MSAKEHASRLEQRTLTLSIGGVLTVAVGSVAYGLYLKSDVVILNGIFSLFSLIGAVLSLLAAKLVVKPENRRFPFRSGSGAPSSCRWRTPGCPSAWRGIPVGSSRGGRHRAAKVGAAAPLTQT